MTLTEWLSALNGYRQKIGAGKADTMSKGDLATLMEQYPDGQ